MRKKVLFPLIFLLTHFFYCLSPISLIYLYTYILTCMHIRVIPSFYLLCLLRVRIYDQFSQYTKKYTILMVKKCNLFFVSFLPYITSFEEQLKWISNFFCHADLSARSQHACLHIVEVMCYNAHKLVGIYIFSCFNHMKSNIIVHIIFLVHISRKKKCRPVFPGFVSTSILCNVVCSHVPSPDVPLQFFLVSPSYFLGRRSWRCVF